jgi:Right handed beta helix region/Putative Ig domain
MAIMKKMRMPWSLLVVLACAGTMFAAATSPLSITPNQMVTATVSIGRRAAIGVTGGTPPYRWRLASGRLPAGLSFDDISGTIVGVPEVEEHTSVVIAVADSTGQTASAPVSVNVLPGDWGTTYFVDSILGKDSNDGTSVSAPWKTLARVSNFSFAPGSRILLKRGSLWREELNFPSSGVSGEPILLDAYGTGNAPVISGADLLPVTAWTVCSNCQQYIWQIPVKTQPNIVLFNGTLGKHESSIANLNGATEWYWSGGTLYVWFTGNPGYSYRNPGVEVGTRPIGIVLFGVSYLTIQNLEVEGANGKPTNGAVYAQASNSLGRSSHDISLHGLTVKNGAGDGVHLEDCNACIVQGLTESTMARSGIVFVSAHALYPVASGAILANTAENNHYDGIGTYGCAVGATCEGTPEPAGLFLSGLVVAGNTVHDNGAGIYFRWTRNSQVIANTSYRNTDTSMGGEGGGIELEASSKNAVEQNLLYGNRTNGLEMSNDRGAGTSITGSSGNLVRYNAVHDNAQSGLFTNAAPSSNNLFAYNVVWNHPNGECFLANGTGHQFYGNTCWNNSTGIDLFTSSTTPTTGYITVKNNIIAASAHNAVKVESGVSMSTLAFDHNDYYNPVAPLSFRWPASSGSFSVWQTSFAYDLHSRTENPEFISSSPTQPSELAVLASSPTIGSGAALSVTYNTGLSGFSAWPGEVQLSLQGQAWNVGAFVGVP